MSIEEQLMAPLPPRKRNGSKLRSRGSGAKAKKFWKEHGPLCLDEELEMYGDLRRTTYHLRGRGRS